MISKIPFDNGIYSIDEDQCDNFNIEFDLISIEAKIKIVSIGFIDKYISKDYKENEHMVYILVRDNIPVYVGQSKDSLTRVMQHKYKNKSNFDRCFMFLKPERDLRQYLDYMEKYLIFKIEENGIILDNTIKKPHMNDILNANKKIVAEDWINTFISFLSVFGVSAKNKEKENSEIITSNNIRQYSNQKFKVVSIECKDEIISENNNRKTLEKLICKIGIRRISNFFSDINTNSSFMINDQPFEKIINNKIIEVRHAIDNNGDNFYYALNISTNDLEKKLLKMFDIMNITQEYKIIQIERAKKF